MAKKLPRSSNGCGFKTGGPPAAHQLKSVSLAVQQEAAKRRMGNSQRKIAEILMQIPQK